jgi:putative FmdB family regulatory protein
MPIYEYKCKKCDKISELFIQKQDEVIKCPYCGSKEMEKVFSSSYIIHMGSSSPRKTCCGREERCDSPPCSSKGVCRKE